VPGFYLSYIYLAGLKLDKIYKDYSACVKVFKEGRKKVKEIFGPEVSITPPIYAPIFYNYIICHGMSIKFPENSEPGVKYIYKYR